MSKLGSRSTAEQALQGQSLKGKKAIVTGANSGIGVETARVMALAGADVVMACRSAESGEKVAAELRAALPSGAGALTVGQLDLSDLKSVKQFAEWYKQQSSALDLLLNNAGIMATPLGKTAQGFELQTGTNHIGHFYLTTLLLPLLESSPAARIVNVSSKLHEQGKPDSLLATLGGDTYQTRPYRPFPAYGDSKLANVLFTRALLKRVPSNILVFSLHPGVIATNLSRSMGTLGSIYRAVGKLFLKSIPQGAATTVYAATAPELSSRSGVYLADCNEAAPLKASLDAELADKVWALSEKAVASVS